MDGFQCRDEQKKVASLAKIPVAIMTADGHIAEKRVKTTAAAALKKPASIVDILDVVERLCAKGKAKF